jgi:hypothetical protein
MAQQESVQADSGNSLDKYKCSVPDFTKSNLGVKKSKTPETNPDSA